MKPRDAVVIVLVDGERILAIRRADGVTRGGYWTPPSGRVESGEALPDAVVREAREELGIAVRAVQPLWQCLTDDGRYRLHWWLAERLDATPLAADPLEIAECRWVTADQYLALQPGFPAHAGFFAGPWRRLHGSRR